MVVGRFTCDGQGSGIGPIVEPPGKVARLFFGEREVVNLAIGFESQQGQASPKDTALAKDGWELANGAFGKLTLFAEERGERVAG